MKNDPWEEVQGIGKKNCGWVVHGSCVGLYDFCQDCEGDSDKAHMHDEAYHY
jgi:hypothetical protein